MSDTTGTNAIAHAAAKQTSGAAKTISASAAILTAPRMSERDAVETISEAMIKYNPPHTLMDQALFIDMLVAWKDLSQWLLQYVIEPQEKVAREAA